MSIKSRETNKVNISGQNDQEERKKQAGLKEIRSFVVRFILLLVLGFLVFGCVFGIRPMKNDDMTPRMSAGDLVLFFRLDNNIHNNEVIVFEKEGIEYISRVVAQSGDSVEITDEATLKVNGSIVMESEIYYTTPQYTSDVTYPLELKDDEYFVLCDYREGGKDSRYFGPVRREEIKGKVITVIRRSNL